MSPAYTVEDQERMSRAGNYFAWQSRLVARHLGQRVIEVGCGIGNFTGALLDRELVVAIDAEPACIERLRQRYPCRPNLHAFACDAGNASFRALARFEPDSIAYINVLEHIEDHRGALQAAASILAPGGVVVLLVPAFGFLYGPIDRNLGHVRRYRRRDVRTLAAAAGFAVRKARYINALGFFGWWANSWLFRREAQSELQISVFDRLVPALARLEAAVPPPFGQSLLAVLEKPA